MRASQAPSGTNVVEQLLLGLLARPFARPSLIAIVVGTFSYATLWWLHSGGLKTVLDWWFYPQIPQAAQAWFRNSPFWPIFSYAQYVVPGFLAGLIAFRNGVMHGLIVGTAVPFVHLAFGIVWGVTGTLAYEIWGIGSGLLYGWALCGAGGLVADLLRISLVRLIGESRAA